MTRTTPAEGIGKETTRSPRSLIGALIIALAVFLGLLVILEGLFRFTSLDRILSLRSVGVYHAQFEIKWFELKDYVRENGGVDVILMGNSMVNTGIDPAVLSAEYSSLTGEDLRIFNFGVEGLTVAPNSVIAKRLVERYHPGTILFVTEMRDYAVNNGLEIEQTLLDNEWFTSDSVTTWLKNNSTVLQHLLPYRNWSRADFLDNFLMSMRRFNDTTTQGYEPDSHTGVDIDIPPDPSDPEEKEDFILFADYAVDPDRLKALGDILSLEEEGMTVIVTEMPVHPNYFVYFGGEQAHAPYLDQLVPFITSRGGSFLPAIAWQLIPLEDRVDHHHLNYKGATRFSKLLAEELADLCQRSGDCLRSAPGGSQ